ncbi:MAG: hypothetical protein HY420_00190 [Candidatus Kerfeldbacteria bacterium]|nr:hypothetical protein [Candidatus Kerfeldbacteria bacterium]
MKTMPLSQRKELISANSTLKGLWYLVVSLQVVNILLGIFFIWQIVQGDKTSGLGGFAGPFQVLFLSLYVLASFITLAATANYERWPSTLLFILVIMCLFFVVGSINNPMKYVSLGSVIISALAYRAIAKRVWENNAAQNQ